MKATPPPAATPRDPEPPSPAAPDLAGSTATESSQGSLRYLIQEGHRQGATGIYIQVGYAPHYRIEGRMVPQDEQPRTTPELLHHYLSEVLTPPQLRYYHSRRKLDATVVIPGFMQCRINCGPTAQGSEALSLQRIQLVAVEETTRPVRRLVEDAYEQNASDVHLQVGEVPRFRVQGKMTRQAEYGKITADQFEQYIDEILTPEQRERFAQKQELDTAILYEDLVRCRVNCSQAMMGGAIVLRLINLDVPTVQDMGLPPVLMHIAEFRQGLVLVTGPVNSGKSTTLATMIRHLNDTVPRKIVTIEDPVEYVHTSNLCLITQREIGLHTQEFKEALKASLRQDPDVILVGEMRDRETVDTALRAAQTGHLVLGTLHTRGAFNAYKRLLNFYAPEEQETMRFQIADSLKAVVFQSLVTTTHFKRAAALEIMMATNTIKDYLYKDHEDDVYLLMEEGQEGMQTLDQALFDLYESGMISETDALTASLNPDDLKYMLKNGVRRSSRSGVMNTKGSGYFAR
ncbi:type IV pilus twitching motility protein PilT [Leptolyngbya sp. FACHB-261]|uniref:type IV pilus twitching motility protein PilT n=1 Tax=Leptolyngbya sp. FACHB-261 TaxID=2692806 RepID=UPI001686406F|nr:PilT/PilU family type 4a pilus ATPase [Leptolyngbya sp. FACHB-261]MBD2103818.1 PilT/PilU family type 4a pilus ATPase [Leptolyngbya sp. FACHB-261]